MEREPSAKTNAESRVLALPNSIAQGLLGLYLVLSQWNPCDSTSVASGLSLMLIAIGIGLGLFTAASRVILHYSDSQAVWRTPILYRLLGLAFLLWLGVCSYMTWGVGNARVAALGFWQSIALVGLLVSVLHQATDVDRVTAIIRWMIGLTSGSCLYALYQYSVSMPRLRERFLAEPDSVLEEMGIKKGSAEAIQAVNRLMSSEPTGPFALTNSLAGLIAPYFVVCIGLIAWDWMRPYRSPSKVSSGSHLRRLLVPTLLVLVLGIVLVLTKSRTAWLAALAGIAVLLLLLPGLRGQLRLFLMQRKGLSFGLFGSAFAFAAFVFWRDPLILWEAGKSLAYRFDYWRGALQLLRESPFFGYGPLNFQTTYTSVKAMTASETPADPHNMWLEIAMWGGVPLLIVALWLGFAVCFGIIHRVAVGAERCDHGAVDESTNAVASTWPWPSNLSIGSGLALLGIVGLALLTFTIDNQDIFISSSLYGATSCAVVYALRAPLWNQLLAANPFFVGTILTTVLGLHLFFSGGWMQPGVMNSWIIGLAIVVTRMRTRTIGTSESGWRTSAVFLMLWSLGAALFALKTYVPETRLSELQYQVAVGAVARNSSEEWKKVLSVHPTAPELAEQIASMAIQRAIDQQLGESARSSWIDLLGIANASLVQRDPRNWQAHFAVAERQSLLGSYLSVQDKERSRALSLAALDSAIKGAGLNPNSVQAQLQLAAYGAVVRNKSVVKKALERAENIDQATPHSDRKMSSASIFLPGELITSVGPFEKADFLLGNGGYVPGEPAFIRLRTWSHSAE